jgi:hypothetical protein
MMEIKAAGDGHKALRKIAAALLAKAADGDVPAINEGGDGIVSFDHRNTPSYRGLNEPEAPRE